MTDEPKLAAKPVPKFASFRPKAISKNVEPAEDESQHQKRREHNSAYKSNSTERNTEREKKKHTQHEHRVHQHGQPRVQEIGGRIDDNPQAAVTKPSPRLPPLFSLEDDPKLYIVDGKGDEANLTYGSLHRYSVSRYHRSGLGNVLGLPSKHKIDRNLSQEKYLVISNQHLGSHTRRDKTAFAKVGSSREIRIKPSDPSSVLDYNADFISVSKTKKRKQRHHGTYSEGSGSMDEADHHYRSIEGKAKPSNQPEDSDMDYTGNSSGSESATKRPLPIDEDLRRIGAELSEKVKIEPSNGHAWLELIEHQELLLTRGQEPYRVKISNAERIGTADIKLSMYEKALAQVTDLQFTERLVLGMMEEGARIWEPGRLANKWQTVLRQNPRYPRLWTKYLDFRQTDFTRFRFEEMKKVFIECLNILKLTIKDAQGNVSLNADLISTQIYVLLRLTLCTREAGYTEQAVAVWQTLLDFNIGRPISSKDDKWDQPTLAVLFEDFWECECPRVGEEAHEGFTKFVADGGVPPESRPDERKTRDAGESLLERWYDVERNHTFHTRTPARTADHVGDDDPYRVVLFSDIQPFLLDLTSPFSQECLLSGFLAFCHLPPLPSTPFSLNTWWSDPFVRNEILLKSNESMRFLFFPSSNFVQDPELWQSTDFASGPTPYEFPMPFGPTTTDSLFSQEGPHFSAFQAWRAENRENEGFLDPPWVQNTLRFLVDRGIGGNDLGEYLLAFELEVFPKSAKKFAKTLIKKRSSCLRLYNAYALMEYRLGNVTGGDLVFSIAINMSKTLDAIAKRQAILLWRSWIWEILDAGKRPEALARLLTFADINITPNLPEQDVEVSTIAPAILLRVQRALTDGRDSIKSLHGPTTTVYYVELLVLLAYLSASQPDSLQTALNIYTSAFSTLDVLSSATQENLHLSRAKLLVHHAQHATAYKPSEISTSLSASISLFPQNTTLLGHYSACEARSRFATDRLRSLLPTLHAPAASLVPHFFALYAELQRPAVMGANTHSVRAAFERLVGSGPGRASAAAWKAFVVWEAGTAGGGGKGSGARVRDVWWRGVRACPWAKELWMLAFRYLREELGTDGLRGVWEMMGEREIRVGVGLESVLERK